MHGVSGHPDTRKLLHLAALVSLLTTMAPEGAGRREFTQLVSDHVLGDIHRNVTATIMNSNRMPHHLGEIVDGRDHVRSTRLSFVLFISSMRPNSRMSTNGPFFDDRDILGPFTSC